MPPNNKRSHSPPPPSTTNPGPQIYRSPPLTDRASTFIAYFSPTLSAPALQAHPDFRTATHRIAAWRKPSAQRTLTHNSRVLVSSGHDDDGERWAGARLERVLAAGMGEGEVGAVVVGRWYGGVMLGPVRFEHVEGCARGAMREWRRGMGGGDDGGAVKRRRGEGEAGEARSREELERVLGERDGSIEVLRGLLAEKKRVAGREGAVAVAESATPKKAMNYKAMPVQVLAKLEKARDATIAFILKELDHVEDEILKAMGDDEDDQDDGNSNTPVPDTAESPHQDGENTKAVADEGSNDAAALGLAADAEHNREQSNSAENNQTPSHNTAVDAG